MTEREIKKTKKWFENFLETYALSNRETIEFQKVVACLAEIQQYRAIGTVEEIIAGLNDGVRTLEQSGVVIETYMSKLEEYQSLGTVEELKALKEKSVAKKPRIIGNAMICPSCPKVYSSDSVTHCTNCGQHLDWE